MGGRHLPCVVCVWLGWWQVGWQGGLAEGQRHRLAAAVRLLTGGRYDAHTECGLLAHFHLSHTYQQDGYIMMCT